jgi:arabinose-5-phosphate isomerase
MDYLAKARRVIEVELEEIERLKAGLGEPFCRAVETILEALDRRNKVVVLGVGKSGHIGEKIAATLTSTGCFAVSLNALNALHGDLGMVSDGDVVLALSNSGETQELTNILPALARFDVRLISITGNPESILARSSTVCLLVKVEQEACPLNLAPTSSTTAMLVLGDALAMVILEARGFRKEDFARFHPGGNLGQSLFLRVHQIMRKADRLPLVQENDTVNRALEEMTQKRGGTTVVVNSSGKLAGVFSQGDFVRQYQLNPNLGERGVSEFMTRSPITIHFDRLAAEVIQVFESHRIDDLVVLNDADEPVGIVDSQDLTRFKLL